MKTLKFNELKKIQSWLVSVFKDREIVKSVFIIGSALNKNSKKINDVDIVQQIEFEDNLEMHQYVQIVNLIRNDFFKEFSCSLHITTFTQNELESFKDFMSKNSFIKLI